VDELEILMDRLGAHPRLGLCLDSCHLWVSGVDVTDPAIVETTVSDVDRRIGLDRLRCLHVNDAAAPLGSNRDRHANVCSGEMGEGLGAFLADKRLQGLPAILETPGPDNHGPDAAEVTRLKELHARWTGATRPGRAARRPGRTASRGGARKTRG
jgi:deoxyribonuclease-4